MFISPMWIQNATSAWMHLYPLLLPTYPGLEMFWKQNICKTVKYKDSEWSTAVTKPTPQRSHDVPGHPLQAITCNTMQISVLFKLVYKEHVFVYLFVCVCVLRGFHLQKRNKFRQPIGSHGTSLTAEGRQQSTGLFQSSVLEPWAESGHMASTMAADCRHPVSCPSTIHPRVPVVLQHDQLRLFHSEEHGKDT